MEAAFQELKGNAIRLVANCIVISLLLLIVLPLTAVEVFAWWVNDVTRWVVNGVLNVTDRLRVKL
jgi:hypothetical protein